MLSTQRKRLGKGLSLIFYMKDPPPPPNKPKSNYGHGDYLLAKEMWEVVGCKVEGHQDPTKDTILQAARKVDIKSYSYIAVVFIGHGGSTDSFDNRGDQLDMRYCFLQLKGETCSVSELRNMFSSLTGIPHFYVIQACRGYNREQMELLATADATFQGPFTSSSSNEATPSSEMLTIFPSCEDNVSYYFPDSGQSILMINLHQVLMENCQKEDFASMIPTVAKKVQEWNEEKRQAKNKKGEIFKCAQTIHHRSSLSYKYFFTKVCQQKKKVFILNYIEFEDKRVLHRRGAEIDSINLQSTFRYIGYDPKIHQNLSKAGTDQVLDQIQQDTSLDFLLLIILSHGPWGENSGSFMTSDGQNYDLTSIQARFTDEACPHLKDKAKVLLCDYDRDKQRHGSVPPITRHMITIHSTRRGLESWRNTTNGTYFVQAMCEVLKEYPCIMIDEWIRLMEEKFNKINESCDTLQRRKVLNSAEQYIQLLDIDNPSPQPYFNF